VVATGINWYQMALSSMAKEHHLLDILGGFQADFLAQEQVFLGGRETPSDSPVEAPQKMDAIRMYQNIMYPLVMTNIAIENGDL
jgi:hypothetical protein